MFNRRRHKRGFSRNSASVLIRHYAFARISVTPWGGLKLTGITIPQTQPGVVGRFSRSTNLSIACSIRVAVCTAFGYQGSLAHRAKRDLDSKRGRQMAIAGIAETGGSSSRSSRKVGRHRASPERHSNHCSISGRNGSRNRHRHVCARSPRHSLPKSGGSDWRVANSISSMAKEKSSRDLMV